MATKDKIVTKNGAVKLPPIQNAGVGDKRKRADTPDGSESESKRTRGDDAEWSGFGGIMSVLNETLQKQEQEVKTLRVRVAQLETEKNTLLRYRDEVDTERARLAELEKQLEHAKRSAVQAWQVADRRMDHIKLYRKLANVVGPLADQVHKMEMFVKQNKLLPPTPPAQSSLRASDAPLRTSDKVTRVIHIGKAIPKRPTRSGKGKEKPAPVSPPPTGKTVNTKGMSPTEWLAQNARTYNRVLDAYKTALPGGQGEMFENLDLRSHSFGMFTIPPEELRRMWPSEYTRLRIAFLRKKGTRKEFVRACREKLTAKLKEEERGTTRHECLEWFMRTLKPVSKSLQVLPPSGFDNVWSWKMP